MKNKKPQEQGVSDKKLTEISSWVKRKSKGKKYRIIIARNKYVIAEWIQGINKNKQLSLASAAKSIYSSILGIAIEEGKIASIDSKIIDYYPEFMQIGEGIGPKPGRYAKPEDKEITFRQLISNMSGYMKPGETPDSTYHYQTFGMNILSHAIATTYGYYDSQKPNKLPGFKKIIDDKIKENIGATWSYNYMNFQHPKKAKIGIFGYYTNVLSNAHDMTRLGILWLNMGKWEKKQIIPAKYVEEATKTAQNIKINCQETQWKYGYAFWTNDHRKIWPNLPKDCYAASGAGQKHIWVCPSLDLVVAQSPGLYGRQSDVINSNLLEMIVDSVI